MICMIKKNSRKKRRRQKQNHNKNSSSKKTKIMALFTYTLASISPCVSSVWSINLKIKKKLNNHKNHKKTAELSLFSAQIQWISRCCCFSQFINVVHNRINIPQWNTVRLVILLILMFRSVFSFIFILVLPLLHSKDRQFFFLFFDYSFQLEEHLLMILVS